MKLLYHGAFFPGSTALHRLEGFSALPGLEAVAQEAKTAPGNWLTRLRWRARWPRDAAGDNAALVDAARRHRPDIVFIDNSRLIDRPTLALLREAGAKLLAYYSPDDMMAPHNFSWPLRLTYPEWDLVFTTKSFNVPELAARGVRHPCLVGNGYSPRDHRPCTREEVGPDFEKFDCVFIGTYERDRAGGIERLAQAGMSIVIYGGNASRLPGWRTINHPNVALRPAVYAEEYSRCLHHGKIALCFLRKANRDRITTRSIEIAATGRPMLAEHTAEHDGHFANGDEYLSFSSDAELVAQAQKLLTDSSRRRRLGLAASQRCLESGYSNDHRAAEMLQEICRVGHAI